MLSENNSFILDLSQNQTILMRKNIRVRNSKLPVDFFNNDSLNRYSPKKINTKKSFDEKKTRETYTPSFERLQELSPLSSKGSERKIETARVSISKEDNLINDVINTARHIRRVFRRKSLDLMKQSCQRQDMELRLPKIQNSRKVSEFF